MRRWGVVEGAQSLVEVALVMPILVFGLIGGTDLARAYAAQVAIENAARAGAEAAVLEVATTDAAIAAYVRDELSGVPGVAPGSATVTVTNTTSGSVQYVTVRVQYTWNTLVAWPLVPNSVAFARSVTMRKVT